MRLAEWMEKNAITKADLAQDLLISASTVYKYVTEERTCRLDIAIKLVELSDGAITFNDLCHASTYGAIIPTCVKKGKQRLKKRREKKRNVAIVALKRAKEAREVHPYLRAPDNGYLDL